MRPRIDSDLHDVVKRIKHLGADTVRLLLGMTHAESDSISHVSSEKELFKLLIISDLHSIFIDEHVFAAFLRVLASNEFDEIVLNGDTLDFPLISTHAKRIFDENFAELDDYSEIKEIEFVRDRILDPIHKLKKSAKIVFRLGNHEERFTRPRRGHAIAEAILSCQRHFNTTELQNMLSLPDFSIEYDATASRKYFDCFSVIHGLSLAQNAAIKNIYQTFGSGSTGHTHRLSSRTLATRESDVIMWVESGCMCKSKLVPYLPTAVRANWAHGFVTATFDLREEETIVFARTHQVIDGRCEFNGDIY